MATERLSMRRRLGRGNLGDRDGAKSALYQLLERSRRSPVRLDLHRQGAQSLTVTTFETRH
jgi:hypothetical protein